MISTVLWIGAAIYAFILWLRGVSPALFRLGKGLAMRKIALFAKPDHAQSLRSLLIDSRLFREKNILDVPTYDDTGRAENATVFLVYWPDWGNNIEQVIAMKPDKCALIVYAPYDHARISDEKMKLIDNKRHSTVVNFRGRLLNDIVASMITTSYEK